jgi:hypothetical protein
MTASFFAISTARGVTGSTPANPPTISGTNANNSSSLGVAPGVQ